MPGNPLIHELVQEVLDSNRTPEEVCFDHPELLGKVRKQLKRAQDVEAQLAELFPSSIDGSGRDRKSQSPLNDDLPDVPGYKLEEVIGRGGMAVVFRARHLKLNRLIALKMLLSGAFASRQERARFVREAEAVAALQHPNIVQIFDVGELERRPYFTMELLEGGSLAQRLGGAPQPAAKSARLLATLATAVAYAPRARYCASRSETGEHPTRSRRYAKDRGLWIGAARGRCARPDHERRPAGNTQLHVSRAGAGAKR